VAENVSFRNADQLKAGIYSIDRGDQLVSIGAYCLMSNHFHILLTPLVDSGVSKFMQKVSTAYVMYFNKTNNRTGGLFEGGFKSVRADSDQYLKYLFAYIHLNPLNLKTPRSKTPRSDLGEKAKAQCTSTLVTSAVDYKYSSLFDYFSQTRDENLILNKGSFPEYFSDINDLRSELTEWILFDEIGK